MGFASIVSLDMSDTLPPRIVLDTKLVTDLGVPTISRQIVLDVTPIKFFSIPTNGALKLPIEAATETFSGHNARPVAGHEIVATRPQKLSCVHQPRWAGRALGHHRTQNRVSVDFPTLGQLDGGENGRPAPTIRFAAVVGCRR
jgi:hypothetical protein